MSDDAAFAVVLREGPDGIVARVRLQGTTALNVVDDVLLGAACAELEALLATPALRAIVLTGRDERAFIGGARLQALRGLTADTAEVFIRAIHAFCAALRAAPVPVIAAVRGYCLGAGLEIALACDLRVADHSARCGMPEVRVGVPSVIEAALLPLQVGWGHARDLLLRGHIIDAAEAVRIGLLEHVTEPAALDALIDTITADIAAAAPGAVAAQKRLFRQWEDSTVSAAIEHGVAAFAAAYAGDEPATYIDRFFARRRGP
jgi:enoyl-CoA hydratase/carnithine racemase